MDNLTHFLVGALIGQMGLKRKTGLAMPTLIIAANIPDIDAVATLLGGHQHLAIRRGITHGPIAMVILPLLLWGIMLWFDRWQTRRGKRPDKRLPIHKGWLLALAYIGCLSHPLFDWLNSYGIRLLEPFSSRWFYGDTLFIIDVWIWIALIAGVWLSLRRERRGSKHWNRPALTGFAFVTAYILSNGLITARAEAVVRAQYNLNTNGGIRNAVPIEKLIANPVPVEFWKRDIIIQSGGYMTLGKKPFSLFSNNKNIIFQDFDKPSINISFVKGKLRNAEINSFLFWSRVPYFDFGEIKECGATPCPFDPKVPIKGHIRDARFANPLVRDRFSIPVIFPLEPEDMVVEQ
jgi:inner membrane protein